VTEPSIVVSEVFGPTLQGEGPHLGERAGFVRLGGCNLHCSWCDTPYTWDATRYDLRDQMRRVSVVSVVDSVAAMAPRVVVVTGGEPLLWQRRPGWCAMLPALAELAPVEVETNGTLIPDTTDPVAHYNVSPKLAHAGDPQHARIVPAALAAFADLARRDRATLKVVVRDVGDVHAAAVLAADAGFPLARVSVMPEGTSALTLAQGHAAVAQAVLDEGLNMTTRLQVLCWGAQRGR
jgi:organic radical activating enzyme